MATGALFVAGVRRDFTPVTSSFAPPRVRAPSPDAPEPIDPKHLGRRWHLTLRMSMNEFHSLNILHSNAGSFKTGGMAKRDGPSLKRRAPEARKSLVIQAADELFREHGYEDTSVSEVAKHAGVAVGTVYLFFPDKASLWIGVVIERKRRIAEVILGQHPKPGDDLRQSISNVLDPVLDLILKGGGPGGDVDRARLESLGPDAVEAFNSVDDAIRQVFGELVQHGKARPTNPVTTPIIASGLVMSGAEACLRGLATVPEMKAELVDAFVRLLRP